MAIGVVLLIWLQKSGALNFHSLATVFRIWPLALAAIGILFLDLFLMSVRISLLFRAQRLSLSLSDAFHLTLTGFLFSMLVVGTAGGEVAKFYYAGRQNLGKRAEIAGALLVDRLIGLFSMILLPLLFAPFSLDLIRSIPAIRNILRLDVFLALALLVGLIVIMFFEPFRYRFSSWLKRWPVQRALWDRTSGSVTSYRRHQVILLWALTLSLAANCAYLVVTAFGFYATAPGSQPLRILLLAPVGHLINALPLTPAGLGVGEVGFNALFKAAGMHGGADALFCVRLWNATIALAYAPIYLWGIGRPQHQHQTIDLQEHGIQPAGEPQFDKG